MATEVKTVTIDTAKAIDAYVEKYIADAGGLDPAMARALMEVDRGATYLRLLVSKTHAFDLHSIKVTFEPGFAPAITIE